MFYFDNENFFVSHFPVFVRDVKLYLNLNVGHEIQIVNEL